MLPIVLAMIACCFVFMALVVAFTRAAGEALNRHVEMPETDAVVIWGPWASHGARCSCNVCR